MPAKQLSTDEVTLTESSCVTLAWETPARVTHCPKLGSYPSDPSTKDLAFLTIYWGTLLPRSSHSESFLVASFHQTMTLWPFLLPKGNTTRKVWEGWPLGCSNHHTNVMGCSQAWQDGEDPVHISAPWPTCPVLPKALSHLCWSRYFRFFHRSHFTISKNSSSTASPSRHRYLFFPLLPSREKYRVGGSTSSVEELPSESLCLTPDLSITLSEIISVALASCFHWHMVLFYIDIFCKATLNMLRWPKWCSWLRNFFCIV